MYVYMYMCVYIIYELIYSVRDMEIILHQEFSI